MGVLREICYSIIMIVGFTARYDALKIKEFSFPSQVHEGDQTSAMCFSGSSDTPVTFTWLKDGVKITSSTNVSVKMDEEFSVIIINPVSLSSSGNYTCTATNLHKTSSYSTILSIVAPPSWLVQPTDVTLVVGEDIILKCSAAGSPNPRIKWKRINESKNSVMKK
ncbi:down syndrome cell adhesion molecule-like protein 1 homolog [Trichonephila clavipes]|nr:down syndrome cell adhesion molecule-like protein 1 homolog [Trichonephila clavipes]